MTLSNERLESVTRRRHAAQKHAKSELELACLCKTKGCVLYAVACTFVTASVLTLEGFTPTQAWPPWSCSCTGVVVAHTVSWLEPNSRPFPFLLFLLAFPLSRELGRCCAVSGRGLFTLLQRFNVPFQQRCPLVVFR